MNKHTCQTLRTLTAAVLAVCSATCLKAQTGVEYFFDSDPGMGKGQIMSVTTGTDTELSIPTNELTPGYHLLGFRAYRTMTENGGQKVTRYAPTIIKLLYIPFSGEDYEHISRLEYFWDTDPGAGKGTPVTITLGREVTLTDIAIPVDDLTLGTHLLGLRAHSSCGWSPLFTQEVFVPKPTTAGSTNISRVEYFWDSDPGYGKGTPWPSHQDRR